MEGGEAEAASRPESVEGRDSWTAAIAAVVILALTYGGPLVVVVGMTNVQATLGTDRSNVALAVGMVWMGTGIGGVVMGHLADRIGIRTTVLFGGLMTAAGLALSSWGSVWALLVGHGVFMGLLGNGSLYPPLLVHVSRWFDRRRGTAVALIASGQYIAGIVWPQPFEALFAQFGWQPTMRAYAVLVLLVVSPLTLLLRPRPPFATQSAAQHADAAARTSVLGLAPNVTQSLICLAAVLCCVPMAIPMAHLVAFGASLGVRPDQAAGAFSVLLVAAFVGRQTWGWLADRIGSLTTLLLSELWQVSAIAAFAFASNEVALYGLAVLYGLGFSGITPSYVLTVRGLFPAAEASWRVPLLLLSSMVGMALGSWLAGTLFDNFGRYAPAFEVGVLFNLANIGIVLFLFVRWRGFGSPRFVSA